MAEHNQLRGRIEDARMSLMQRELELGAHSSSVEHLREFRLREAQKHNRPTLKRRFLSHTMNSLNRHNRCVGA